MRRFQVWILTAVLVGGASSLGIAQEAPQKPNVLFIAADDLNTDLGCYGHPLVRSPNLDQLASRGVLFENAYCQYPVCNPSRSSFMTGCYPDQTGVLSNGDNFRKKLPNVVTIPQWFAKHGYYAARVGKIFHYGVPLQIGTPGADDAQSWQHTVNPRGVDRDALDKVHTLVPGQYGGTLSWLSIDSQDDEHTDGIGATEAIRLLEERHPKKTGQPFFLAVGFYRPHTPYVAPTHYFNLYPRNKIQPVMLRPGDRDDIPLAALHDRPHQLELTVPQRQEIIQAYYAAISLMDAQVGRLLKALEFFGLAENTIVVFVSDHGYHLGAHGLWQKSDLFEGSTHVPLIIADPRSSKKGLKTKAITELVDLYPTLAELCGLPLPEHLSGESLTPVLQDPHRPGKEAALTVTVSRGAAAHPELKGKGRILGYSVRTPRYRYTEWANGELGAELYDYQEDPEEYTNLVKSDSHQATVQKLKSLLAQKKQKAASLDKLQAAKAVE